MESSYDSLALFYHVLNMRVFGENFLFSLIDFHVLRCAGEKHSC